MRRSGIFNRAAMALLAVFIAACSDTRTSGGGESMRLTAHPRAALLAELKAFERRMGFEPTKNFLRLSAQTTSFPYCGHVSRLYLPYSYEDPAIGWSEDRECSALGGNVDVFRGESEAVGERGAPVTQSMLEAPLERLIYVLFHEDCHDQFAFPHGFEEALCNAIAYRAMVVFTTERYGPDSPETLAARRYVDEGVRNARLTVAFYEEIAALYARHARSEISTAALLKARAWTFANAARALEWDVGVMNNVVLANAMTYSRHYDFLADVQWKLGADLVGAVMFFRHVDAIKPTPAQAMKRHGLIAERSVEFVRTYEGDVIDATRKALAERPGVAQSVVGPRAHDDTRIRLSEGSG